jgi:HAD superfamily hydrolase (TIGR01509 family)
MPGLKALLWDVDGTLAETERDGHRVAFNAAFEAWGLPWHWDEAHYGSLLRITGGRERILYDMNLREAGPTNTADREALARALHERKNELYAELVRSGAIRLRDGVLALMQECLARDVRMAIATTTSRANVDALLRAHLGDRWSECFAAIVCGEDVQRKKPDPEVYLRALEILDLQPYEAVAIEDSPNGVAAAHALDIPVLVTRSAYFADCAVHGALAVGPGLDRRSGWRPALPRGAANDEPVSLDDVESWLHDACAGTPVSAT